MSFEMGSTIQNMSCPTEDIAAFIDGELSFVRELEMDSHFACCSACADELNTQKDFLRHLDLSLRHDNELELPEDFTKHIVANAESTVSGLRRPRERFNALFIIAGLLLFVLFAMGAEAGTVFERFWSLVDKFATVGGIFVYLIYSFFVGISVIVRGVSSQVELGLSGLMGLALFFVVFSLLVSRTILSIRRV